MTARDKRQYLAGFLSEGERFVGSPVSCSSGKKEWVYNDYNRKNFKESRYSEISVELSDLPV